MYANDIKLANFSCITIVIFVTRRIVTHEDNKKYFQFFHDCRYGIAAVVGGVDSAPTEWQDITVPPREGEDNKPTMGDVSKENDTLSFELKPDGDNSKCKVGLLEENQIM